MQRTSPMCACGMNEWANNYEQTKRKKEEGDEEKEKEMKGKKTNCIENN